MEREHRKIADNNKGFSLVEIMVVMAIMAILVGVMALSFSVVNNANVSKAANKFDSLLGTARAQSMAKGQLAGTITLKYQNGNLYYQLGDPATAPLELLCTGTITVTAFTSLTDYSVRTGGTVMTDGMTYTIKFTQAGTLDMLNSDIVSKLIFTKDTRNVEVILYKETGKHTTNMFYT